MKVFILFSSLVCAYTLPKSHILLHNSTIPHNKTITLNSNKTILHSNSTLNSNKTISLNSSQSSKVIFNPSEKGNQNIPEIENEADKFKYILIVENLLNDLYNKTISFISQNRLNDLQNMTSVLSDMSYNVNRIKSDNANVTRPPCEYTFNTSSIDSLKHELVKFERIAVGMYQSLNLTDPLLLNIKSKHIAFLDSLLNTNETSIAPLNVRSVIGLVGNNTLNCSEPIPFVSFFKLELDSLVYHPNDLIKIPELFSSGYCAFVGNDTIYTQINNTFCAVNVSFGTYYLYIANNTMPITDKSISSVLAGPVAIDIIDPQVITSNAFRNSMGILTLVFLLFL